MLAAADLTQLPLQTVAETGALTVLSSEGPEALICTRPYPQRVHTWLSALAPSALPKARLILREDQVEQAVTTLLSQKGHSPSPETEWLIQDIRRLATALHALVRTDRLRLRIEAVTNDACSKFHIDNVTARLICTYRGPGTELALPAPDGSAAAQDQVPTGAPILLKGKRWPGVQPLTLHHRSPAIKGTGLTRLLIVLEGVTGNKDLSSTTLRFADASQHPWRLGQSLNRHRP